MYYTGTINREIDGGKDCEWIYFSDLALSSPIDPVKTASQVECIQVYNYSKQVAFTPVFGSFWTQNNEPVYVVAIEFYAGEFSPRGLSMDAQDNLVDMVKENAPWIELYNIHRFKKDWSEVDIGLKKNFRKDLYW